jgi:predicted transcriptional regulator
MVSCDQSGRHRYYRLAGPEVADALEAMETLAMAVIPRERLGPPRDPSMRFARLCYDHLAGRLGVELADALADKGFVSSPGRGFRVTRKGRDFLRDFGIDLDDIESQPRLLVRGCADWSEHRPHIGGALGAALFESLLDRGWLRMRKDSRKIQVTSRGRRELADRLDMACG